MCQPGRYVGECVDIRTAVLLYPGMVGGWGGFGWMALLLYTVPWYNGSDFDHPLARMCQAGRYVGEWVGICLLYTSPSPRD